MRNILLSDDDADDRALFYEAMQDLPSAHNVTLTITNDGMQLMDKLASDPDPDLIFLDLNMPLKNGFECLEEIRRQSNLKTIPIVVISTSSSNDIVDLTYVNGANRYICKPPSFVQLRRAIDHVLSLDSEKIRTQPDRREYVVSVES